MNQIVIYHEERAKMDSELTKIIIAGAGLFTSSSFMGIWLKKMIDDNRKDTRLLEKAILKDYMDKDETIKMYSYMSSAQELKIDLLSTQFEKMDDKLDLLLERSYENKSTGN